MSNCQLCHVWKLKLAFVISFVLNPLMDISANWNLIVNI